MDTSCNSKLKSTGEENIDTITARCDYLEEATQDAAVAMEGRAEEADQPPWATYNLMMTRTRLAKKICSIVEVQDMSTVLPRHWEWSYKR